MSLKTCLVITGPTAVGKTALSMMVAKAFSTGIISADSRQCYKELNIGVAKPSPEELSLVPHYFINSHSVHDPLSAAGFEAYALSAAEQIFQSHDRAVLVGGTGFYIDAFCNGINEVPVVDPAVRDAIRKKYAENGFLWLQEQVRSADPLYFASGEISNPHRLLRSLEVVLSTGRSIRSFQTGEKAHRNFRIVRIGLELPRPELNARIDQRVDDMIGQGLVEEVTALLPLKHLLPLNTIGYKEIISYLEGHDQLPGAIEKIKIHTRQYAKRQMTWFRRNPETTWFSPKEEDKVMEFCLNPDVPG